MRSIDTDFTKYDSENRDREQQSAHWEIQLYWSNDTNVFRSKVVRLGNQPLL